MYSAYPVMGEPPLSTGRDQVTVMEALPLPLEEEEAEAEAEMPVRASRSGADGAKGRRGSLTVKT